MIPAQLKLIPGGLKRATCWPRAPHCRPEAGQELCFIYHGQMAVPQHLKTVEFVSVHHFDGTKSAISRPIPDTKTPPNLAEGALKAREGNGPQLRMGLGLEIGDDWSVRGWQYILFTIQLLDILEVEPRN